MATVLEIRERQESEENLKYGKVRESKQLSESKSLTGTIPQVQFDDLSFYQNAISRSQGNFSQVREKSGKMKVEERWPSR